jgi:hypothetical protein
MEEIGQPSRALVPAPALACGAAALAVAVIGCVVSWPFAIDDAWISVRYARHLASGAGYVWNVGGPRTDGVTPLPWAFMLAPLASAAPLVVLARAKLAGALVWSMSAAAWGVSVGRARSPWWAKASAIVLLGVDLPVAAHAVSGMETPFATALATAAAIAYRRPRLAALLAGLAATLRPELVGWAVVLAAALAWTAEPGGADAERAPRVISSLSIAGAPFAACALVRLMVFGRLAPLAVLAKPSDLRHGLAYVAAAAIFSLAPIVLFAPIALARARGPALALALAACAHLVVVAVAGGDWMPYARFLAPVVPSMLLAFVLIAPQGVPELHVGRVLAALVVAAWFGPRNVSALRRAGADRAAMITAAAPMLASERRIAAVDIGWVSAVSEAHIVDLAGVTDPEVAAFGGGHTSKRIDPSYLLAQSPDVAVFYADPLPQSLADVNAAPFVHVVAARLVAASAFAQHFAPSARLPLGATSGYVIFARRPMAATSREGGVVGAEGASHAPPPSLGGR